MVNGIYGAAWFGGSALLGILYDAMLVGWVVGVAVLLQVAALPVFLRLKKTP
jgi:hypothetical protein